MKTILILSLLLCAGCSTWQYHRTPEGEVKASATQWFLDSELDNVMVRVDPNGRRVLTIGKFTRNPDEESIEAVVRSLILPAYLIP